MPDLLGQRFPLKDGNLKSRDEQQSASASGALGPSAGSCWAALVTVKSAKLVNKRNFAGLHRLDMKEVLAAVSRYSRSRYK